MKVKAADRVRIAEFKARLSRYLRDVRRGHPLTLLDRETPIARVLPYLAGARNLVIRHPTREVKEVRLPPPPRRRTNSLRVLLEERRRDR